MERKKCWLCGQTHAVSCFDGDTCKFCWQVLEDATEEFADEILCEHRFIRVPNFQAKGKFYVCRDCGKEKTI